VISVAASVSATAATTASASANVFVNSDMTAGDERLRLTSALSQISCILSVAAVKKWQPDDNTAETWVPQSDTGEIWVPASDTAETWTQAA
jgi:hypothetical protein